MIIIRRQNAGSPERMVVCAVQNNKVLAYWENQKAITDRDLCWLALLGRIRCELKETAERIKQFDFSTKHGFCL